MRYILMFLLLVVGCADQSPSLPNPVKGDLMAQNALPAVVRVLGRVACTGTFITPTAVLTAAHCLEGGGPYNVRSHAVNASASRGYTLPKNKNYGTDDLGILTFDTPVVSNELVIPIGNEPAIGDTVTLIGYGCNDIHSRVGGGIKRMGTNVLSSIADYLEVTTPLSREIFGPKNRVGSCFGDSGSPLLKNVNGSYTVIGVDHGARSDSSEQISIFVNIFKEDNWKFIQAVTGIR